MPQNKNVTLLNAHMKNRAARVPEVLIQIPDWNIKTSRVITASAIKVL
jgi:hypothetical protein